LNVKAASRKDSSGEVSGLEFVTHSKNQVPVEDEKPKLLNINGQMVS
jgi:hypothetical protein